MKTQSKEGDLHYGHGMVWNRDLPGAAGDVKLAFDLRMDLAARTGFGTANDPTHPEWGVHFALRSIKQERGPRGEVRLSAIGVVTGANSRANVGKTVRMLAETASDTTAIAMALDSLNFAGAGIVVIDEAQVHEPLIITLIRIILGR